MRFKPKFEVTSGSGYSATFGSKGATFNGNSASGGTHDHQRLYNREKANCHPISAITDLTGELNARPDEALTNMEIAAILARE